MTDLEEQLLPRVPPEAPELVAGLLPHRLRGVSKFRKAEPRQEQDTGKKGNRRGARTRRRRTPTHRLDRVREPRRRRYLDALRANETPGEAAGPFDAGLRIGQRG